MQDNARRNPNSWLYVIDAAFDSNSQVPPWAVVGAYPVNASGVIVADFHPNEQYLPSPRALGLPEPHDELERRLQLVYAKHLRPEDLPAAVVDATLHVYAVSPAQRTLMGMHDRTGRVVVPAYTSKSLVPATWPHSRAVVGRDIVLSLDGVPVAINPNSPFAAVVPATRLLSAAAAERS